MRIGVVRSDQAFGQGQAGQVGAAAGSGFVPDPVQVRGDRACADGQLGGDLRVGMASGDQGDQDYLTLFRSFSHVRTCERAAILLSANAFP